MLITAHAPMTLNARLESGVSTVFVWRNPERKIFRVAPKTATAPMAWCVLKRLELASTQLRTRTLR